jgi:oxygen-independent coproporphyrinogen-3 oxidase
MVQKTLALYLHFPFCRQKCYYCDFNSYSGLEMLIPDYFRAMRTEIGCYLPQTNPVGSVYFGGGTPSYLPVESLNAILQYLKEQFFIAPHTEVTIEANPGTVGIEQLLELKAAGFNRLSLGLQAFQVELLEMIGRIHDWNDFVTCYHLAREVGFDNIGVDLIFGLPRQTLEHWRESLRQVVALNPEHISAYCLQLEPGTVLYNMVVGQKILALPDEETVAAMMEVAMDYLETSGYEHYEISNYARPERRSRHNLGYWQSRDYLGFGAGAYSTVYGERWNNFKNPHLYIERLQKGQSAVAGRELLNRRTAAVEALMLGLRLRDGINLKQFRERYEIDLMKKARVEVANLFEEKLIDKQEGAIFLTKKGVLISNYVIARLMQAL